MAMPRRGGHMPLGQTLILLAIVCALFWVSMASCAALAVQLVARRFG